MWSFNAVSCGYALINAQKPKRTNDKNLHGQL